MARKSLSTFFNQETSNHNESQTHDQSLSNQIVSPLHFNPENSPLNSQSPDSGWSFSPPSSLTPSNSSLLYCCISSLHRDGGIYSISVAGNLVLTGSSSRRLHAWQSIDCHAKGYIQTSSGEIRTMITHDDILITSHKDLKIRIWKIKNNNYFKARKVISLPNISIPFKHFICSTSNNKGTPQNKNNPNTHQHKDIISCMAYNQIEGLLYTGSYDKTVKVWKLSEMKCIESFIAHQENINDLIINPQNCYIFTCSSDGTVKMWLKIYGENSHALIKVFCFKTYPFHALAISIMSLSQKSLLYAGSSDGYINFWVQENSLQYNHGGVLEGHRFAVLCLVVVENIVISGSEDSTIRIWKRKEGKDEVSHECLGVLEGHRAPIRCLGVYNNSKFPKKESMDEMMNFLVYSGSLDFTFKVWRVKILPEIKKFSSRNDHIIMEDYGQHSRSDQCEEISPVLSPSWVKMKLQCRSLHY